MAFNFPLPQRRLEIPNINVPRRTIPVDQIIAVKGRNPWATGIEMAGNVLGQYLQQKAQMQMKGQQLAEASRLLGEKTPSAMSGMSLDNYIDVLKIKQGMTKQKNEDFRIRELEKQLKVPEGSLGNDYQVAELIARSKLIENRASLTENSVSTPVPLINFDPYKGTYTTADGEVVTSVPKNAKIQRMQMTPAEKESQVRVGKLKEMDKIIDFAESELNKIPSGEGLMGRAKGLGLSLEAWLQTDPAAAAYVTTMSGLRSQIARGLGEVGNLAQNEQEYALSLLPKLTDNTETRKEKLRMFRNYIRMKIGDSASSSSSLMPQMKWNEKTNELERM